jgi:hypothetical protein
MWTLVSASHVRSARPVDATAGSPASWSSTPTDTIVERADTLILRRLFLRDQTRRDETSQVEQSPFEHGASVRSVITAAANPLISHSGLTSFGVSRII